VTTNSSLCWKMRVSVLTRGKKEIKTSVKSYNKLFLIMVFLYMSVQVKLQWHSNLNQQASRWQEKKVDLSVGWRKTFFLASNQAPRMWYNQVRLPRPTASIGRQPNPISKLFGSEKHPKVTASSIAEDSLQKSLISVNEGSKSPEPLQKTRAEFELS
jgi:hypothetical protein